MDKKKSTRDHSTRNTRKIGLFVTLFSTILALFISVNLITRFQRLFSQWDDWVLIYRFTLKNDTFYYSSTWNKGNGLEFIQLSLDDYPNKDVMKLESDISAEIRRMLTEINK